MTKAYHSPGMLDHSPGVFIWGSGLFYFLANYSEIGDTHRGRGVVFSPLSVGRGGEGSGHTCEHHATPNVPHHASPIVALFLRAITPPLLHQNAHRTLQRITE